MSLGLFQVFFALPGRSSVRCTPPNLVLPVQPTSFLLAADHEACSMRVPFVARRRAGPKRNFDAKSRSHKSRESEFVIAWKASPAYTPSLICTFCPGFADRSDPQAAGTATALRNTRGRILRNAFDFAVSAAFSTWRHARQAGQFARKWQGFESARRIEP
ncbi:MAG: hypothetical protein EKK40_04490 [Bradyrhizobiaceae bacterium]|nr:MAG: hypothetical protein EKK40_04490 [Bradyrhizobiaceae bacterium]